MKFLVPSLRLNSVRNELDVLIQREGGVRYRLGVPEMRTRTLLGRQFRLSHTPLEFTGPKPSQRFLNELHEFDPESLESVWPTDMVLGAALAVIEDEGLFRSRHRAAEEGEVATSDLTLMVLEGSLRLEPHWVSAEKVVQYSQALWPETAFQQAMQRELRHPLLHERRLGLAAAAAWAWIREGSGPASTAQGTRGERLRQVKVRLREAARSTSGMVNRYKWEDQEGNHYTWFSSKSLGLARGDWTYLSGTVVDHHEFNGQVETRLKNVRVS